MSEDGGTGAPGTGSGAGQGGQQSGGSGSSGPPAAGGQPTGEQGGQAGGAPPDGGRNGNAGGGHDDGWAQIAQEFGDPEQVRKRLGHARTWEERAKQNHQTLDQQLADFRKEMAERDERDVQRSGKTALAQLKAELAQAGVKWDDVDEPLRPDPVRLLNDGEPDEDAIGKYAAALAKHAGRPTPDHDQGQRGGEGPSDMNALIRRAAGRGA